MRLGATTGEVHAAFGRITAATADLDQQRQERPALGAFRAQLSRPSGCCRACPQFIGGTPELDVVFWATSPPYDLLSEHLRRRYPARRARHRRPRRHDVSGRAHRADVQPGACRRHPADPLCRTISLLHPLIHSDQMSGPLAGLAGASSRPCPRSRPRTAFRPVVHVDRHRRRRARGLPRQHPAGAG